MTGSGDSSVVVTGGTSSDPFSDGPCPPRADPCRDGTSGRGGRRPPRVRRVRSCDPKGVTRRRARRHAPHTCRHGHLRHCRGHTVAHGPRRHSPTRASGTHVCSRRRPVSSGVRHSRLLTFSSLPQGTLPLRGLRAGGTGRRRRGFGNRRSSQVPRTGPGPSTTRQRAATAPRTVTRTVRAVRGPPTGDPDVRVTVGPSTASRDLRVTRATTPPPYSTPGPPAPIETSGTHRRDPPAPVRPVGPRTPTGRTGRRRARRRPPVTPRSPVPTRTHPVGGGGGRPSTHAGATVSATGGGRGRRGGVRPHGRATRRRSRRRRRTGRTARGARTKRTPAATTRRVQHKGCWSPSTTV